MKFSFDDGSSMQEIGTLEWTIGDEPILESHLEQIRPTTTEDVNCKNIIRGASYCLNLLKIGDNLTDAIKQALISVSIYVLRTAKKEQIEGKVLLCFVIHTEHLDSTIVCNLYKPERKGENHG